MSTPQSFPAFLPEQTSSELRSPHLRPRRVNVGRRERRASVAGGLALAAIGARRGGPLGAVAALAGLGLVARGVTGHCAMYQALSRDTARSRAGEQKHLDVSRSIQVLAPPARVKELLTWPKAWLGRSRRISVEQTGESRLTIEGRLGWLGRKTLELEIEPLGEGGVVWRTAPDAWLRVEARAEISGSPSGRGTEVRVRLHASPRPAIGMGLVRRAVEKIGERLVAVGLSRLKQLAETGEIASTGALRPTRPVRTEATS
jgi:uncharacterized membrane protein